MDSLHPSESKKNARSEGALIVYEDEASFRQTPTLYRTWARRGQQPQIPTRGERHTQKILGAVSVPTGDFVWRHQGEYFNAETYLSFVEEELLPHYYRRCHRVYCVLAADVRKWDMDGGLGLRPDIFPSSKPLSPQAERADGSARAAG